jgi:hypothetical protein
MRCACFEASGKIALRRVRLKSRGFRKRKVVGIIHPDESADPSRSRDYGRASLRRRVLSARLSVSLSACPEYQEARSFPFCAPASERDYKGLGETRPPQIAPDCFARLTPLPPPDTQRCSLQTAGESPRAVPREVSL